MGHTLQKSDGILVLCSHDIRVRTQLTLLCLTRFIARHLHLNTALTFTVPQVGTFAAELFNKGMGDWILFSGGFGTGPHSGANLNGAKLFLGRTAVDMS